MRLKPPVKFIPRGPHHLYIGLIMMGFGWLMVPYDYYWPWNHIFYLVGAAVAFDDLIEHTITGSTPLRWFFEKILFPFMRKVSEYVKKTR